MTTSAPPKLAVALLRRFLPDNEPLAGDLVEQFAVRQSRLWFWRQALLAIVIRPFQPRDEQHPLGLGTADSGSVGHERSFEWRRVNLTGSPVPGVGGLGLVALGVLTAVVRPDAWWIFAPAITGGVALGLAMVIVRRRRPLPSADAGSSGLLDGVGSNRGVS